MCTDYMVAKGTVSLVNVIIATAWSTIASVEVAIIR